PTLASSAAHTASSSRRGPEHRSRAARTRPAARSAILSPLGVLGALAVPVLLLTGCGSRGPQPAWGERAPIPGQSHATAASPQGAGGAPGAAAIDVATL